MTELAVTHPRLRHGGSEARAMWALQALRERGSLTLVTCGPVELGRLNRQYGTDLRGEEIRIRRCPVLGGMSHVSVAGALQGAVFQRWVHWATRDADLVVSSYNICRTEAPALQFIADFSWDRELRRRLHPVPEGVRGRFHKGWVGKMYNGLVAALGGFPSDPGRENYTVVANSEWSASVLEERHGVEAPVLHPPVCGDFPAVDWEERKRRFVALGRLNPMKRYERLIRIVGRLRDRGHEVGLDVVAPLRDEDYARHLREVASKSNADLRLLGGRFGEEKLRTLPRYRYGLHGCVGEAFGIAVAELAKAGCVTFVPRLGAAREVVGDETLVYETEGEAVDKIERVLERPQRARILHRALSERAARFDAERFVRGLRSHADRKLGVQ